MEILHSSANWLRLIMQRKYLLLLLLFMSWDFYGDLKSKSYIFAGNQTFQLGTEVQIFRKISVFIIIIIVLHQKCWEQRNFSGHRACRNRRTTVPADPWREGLWAARLDWRWATQSNRRISPVTSRKTSASQCALRCCWLHLADLRGKKISDCKWEVTHLMVRGCLAKTKPSLHWLHVFL